MTDIQRPDEALERTQGICERQRTYGGSGYFVGTTAAVFQILKYVAALERERDETLHHLTLAVFDRDEAQAGLHNFAQTCAGMGIKPSTPQAMQLRLEADRKRIEVLGQMLGRFGSAYLDELEELESRQSMVHTKGCSDKFPCAFCEARALLSSPEEEAQCCTPGHCFDNRCYCGPTGGCAHDEGRCAVPLRGE